MHWDAHYLYDELVVEGVRMARAFRNGHVTFYAEHGPVLETFDAGTQERAREVIASRLHMGASEIEYRKRAN